MALPSLLCRRYPLSEPTPGLLALGDFDDLTEVSPGLLEIPCTLQEGPTGLLWIPQVDLILNSEVRIA